MYRFFPLILLLVFSSCSTKYTPPPIEEDNGEAYLHLSHTRTSENPNMLPEVESLDYSKYEMLWLGGDLAKLTSIDEEAMNYVDAIYNLSDENTLWALGNHDYSDLSLIEQYTNRAPYFAYSKNGICLIVLDTQDSLSNIVGEQLLFFNSVMDTLSESSYLVLLTHKLIWMYSHPVLDSKIDSISNGKFGDCFYCLNPNNFYDDIYPRLIEAKQGGINVKCIAGDIGFKVNSFSFTTDEEIEFLASGVSTLEENNKALLFKHNREENELSWEFKLLSEL